VAACATKEMERTAKTAAAILRTYDEGIRPTVPCAQRCNPERVGIKARADVAGRRWWCWTILPT
jgi:hypothetical protein